VHDLVNENMAAAARLHVVEHGLDPRSFPLVASGGAGPVHACHLAEKLGITKIICPPRAGVASAFGLIQAPPRIDVTQSVFLQVDSMDWETLLEVLEQTEQSAKRELGQAAGRSTSVGATYWLRMRYRGQMHDGEIALPGAVLASRNTEELNKLFAAYYRDTFGHDVEGGIVEAVGVRVEVTALNPPPPPAVWDGAVGRSKGERRKVRLSGLADAQQVDVLPSNAINVDELLHGPLVIEDIDSTIVVERGWTVRRLPAGALVLELVRDSAEAVGVR